jgi:hypothetical protein
MVRCCGTLLLQRRIGEKNHPIRGFGRGFATGARVYHDQLR